MQLRTFPLAIKLGVLAALAIAALLLVGFLTKTEQITAVNPVPCPTVVPVATATPDGGPTYTATVTFTPCLIKLTSTPTLTITPAPPTPTPFPTGGAMSLSVTNTFLCPGGPQAGKVCMGQGGQFDVVVNADVIPQNGFQLAQTWINYGNDLGAALDGAPKAITKLWPDERCWSAGFAKKSFDNDGNGHDDAAYAGCAPLLSHQGPTQQPGPLYAFTLTCTPDASSHLVTLEAYGGPNAVNYGSLFAEWGTNQQMVPANSGSPDFIVDSVTVNCVTPPQPEPGDTDSDGCSDQREIGPDETLGGLRDFTNPNDFYDVLGPGAALPTDGVIDLPNDILGVIEHFAPSGAAPYDAQFDRGPSAGPNPWNMTAPDGVIDLPNDILGVIQQFNHSCQ